MNRILVGTAAVVVGVGLFAAKSPIFAGETKPVQTAEKQTNAPLEEHYIVLVGPVEFIAFTPSKRVTDYRTKGFALLAVDTVTLPGQEAPLDIRLAGKEASLDQGDELYLGDTIESGIIRGTGGTYELKDSEGNITLLRNGENALVIPVPPGDRMMASGMTCTECAALAKESCGAGGVKSVTCGLGGTCAFSCFPTPVPVPDS